MDIFVFLLKKCLVCSVVPLNVKTLNNFSVNLLQTREEKKLEAIVKAFERMEKREQHQRKKEAQLEQVKKPKEKEKEKEGSGAGKSERDSGKSDASSNTTQKAAKQHSMVCSLLFHLKQYLQCYN